MDVRKLKTQFAPAERAEESDLKRQSGQLGKAAGGQPFLGAIPEVFLIVNQQRQIVYSNEALLKYLGLEEGVNIQGLRPGEVLDCVHAFEAEGGCGTTEFCKTCGAVKAILDSFQGKRSIQECRIIQGRSGGALDLRVWATPYCMDGELFSMFVVSDISHEKRREALERIFFHDILNTAGGLLGFAKLLREKDGDQSVRFRDTIQRLAEKLINEIQSQRELIAAENHELGVKPIALNSFDILHGLVLEHGKNEEAGNREIAVAPESMPFTLAADSTLLRRVLGNLIKNAMEAVRPGETVTIGCRLLGDECEFWTHNAGCIPRDVQLQIFQRSFTTKGRGRGLGAYSAKLLTERYLNGVISFTSNKENGTVFRVRLPLVPNFEAAGMQSG